MTMQAQDTVRIFRFAVLPHFAVVLFVGIPIYFCLVLIMEHGPVNVVALAMGALGGMLTGLLGTWVVTLCFRLKLTEDGVYGHSSWGIRRFIRWQDVRVVRPIRVFHVKYLRLFPERGKPTWLAMNAVQPADIKQALRRLAPPGNPIHAFL